ncbi:MAG: CoA pyrophosphatase [Bacteroidales bacterium]|nr:CoA pyrophosphatase [Bacteroidales bacterium]
MVMIFDAGKFNLFCKKLEKRLDETLPGNDAHMQMASKVRLKELNFNSDISKAIRSAVLILFYPGKTSTQTVFILRPQYDGVHAGQIAFPGGRAEPEDRSIIDTALREAYEEVNIKPQAVKVLGTLSDLYIPPSNYIVTPVVGTTDKMPEFERDPAEVDEIILADAGFLLDPSLIKETIVKVRGFSIEAPYFDINGYVVWGATAMILNELKAIIESMN